MGCSEGNKKMTKGEKMNYNDIYKALKLETNDFTEPVEYWFGNRKEAVHGTKILISKNYAVKFEIKKNTANQNVFILNAKKTAKKKRTKSIVVLTDKLDYESYRDYNTDHFSECELYRLCQEFEMEDNNENKYFVSDGRYIYG